MKQDGCYYCERDEAFCELLYELCDLGVSKVFFCKDQTLPGRCTIMVRDHYEELYELPKATRDAFMDDVCALSEAIMRVYHPDKINCALYGDKVRHVHFTVCPKYEGKIGWGKAFELFPENRVFLTPEEYRREMDRLRQELLQPGGGRV